MREPKFKIKKGSLVEDFIHQHGYYIPYKGKTLFVVDVHELPALEELMIYRFNRRKPPIKERRKENAPE